MLPPRRLGRQRALGIAGVFAAVLATSAEAGPPTGAVTAIATATRSFPGGVRVSYMEPVNCTLEFSQDIMGFNVSALTLGNGTLLQNFQELTMSRYTFQLYAEMNVRLSVQIAPLTIVDFFGVYNSEATALYTADFFKFPPLASLRLDGYPGRRTRLLSNLAYIVFNSTTSVNGDRYFTESVVSLSPAIVVANFTRVTDMMFKFNFEIPQQSSSVAPTCTSPSASLPSSSHSAFVCSECPRSQRCLTDSLYPPRSALYLEFPLELRIEAIPTLGMAATTLPFFYDTLWAEVTLTAPQNARGPFPVIVSWSEEMIDPVTTLNFGPGGPTVDQTSLSRNRTVLNASAFQVIIEPATTGILSIFVNGTRNTRDTALNTNDFRLIDKARTGDNALVVFSAGPPFAGDIFFEYSKPPEAFEYGSIMTSLGGFPSLKVLWSGFTTAAHYDFWMTWGTNSTTPVYANLTASQTSHVFDEFRAQLGVEYVAHVRAYSYWGEATLVSKSFLHPRIDVLASGRYDYVRLPTFVGPLGTNVTCDLILGNQSFLSLNPLKVLSIRSMDRLAGDTDPCKQNSNTLRCTAMNFHIEVPFTQFLVFRNPIRLQFTFGRQGWEDLYFRPQLRYWEAYREEWRTAASSCPPGQVFERWNYVHNIYTVDLCHLSQFAMFELYSPVSTTSQSPELVEPNSFEDPGFVIGFSITLATLLVVFVMCYFVCRRPWARSMREQIAFRDFGIRSLAERVPRHRRWEEGFMTPAGTRRRSGSQVQSFLSSVSQDCCESERRSRGPRPQQASQQALPGFVGVLPVDDGAPEAAETQDVGEDRSRPADAATPAQKIFCAPAGSSRPRSEPRPAADLEAGDGSRPDPAQPPAQAQEPRPASSGSGDKPLEELMKLESMEGDDLEVASPAQPQGEERAPSREVRGGSRPGSGAEAREHLMKMESVEGEDLEIERVPSPKPSSLPSLASRPASRQQDSERAHSSSRPGTGDKPAEQLTTGERSHSSSRPGSSDKPVEQLTKVESVEGGGLDVELGGGSKPQDTAKMADMEVEDM